jgi:hypothetical protein
MDDIGLTRAFKNRVSRMTTAEMRRSVEQWQKILEKKGNVPPDREQAAQLQVAYVIDQIEQRKAAGMPPRHLVR